MRHSTATPLIAVALLAACDEPYKYGDDTPLDRGAGKDACVTCDLGLVTGPDAKPPQDDLGVVITPDFGSPDWYKPPQPDLYKPPAPDLYKPPQPDLYKPPQPDLYKPPAPDSGPTAVSPGFYTYKAVPAYGLVSPPSAAWHPTGAYALVLSYSDKVFRFDAKTKALTQAASVGTKIYWRAVTFTPKGDKAVLLGRHTSNNEGRIYIYDHAKKTLTEMTTERLAGSTYEALAYSPDGKTARLLASKSSGSSHWAYVWTFDAAKGRNVSGVKVTFTSAGCQDLAWATDAFSKATVAVACGVNGVTLMHLDGGGAWVKHTKNAGNTSRIAGRPQGDYALAVCWSCSGKVYTFEQGAWSTDFYSPKCAGAYQVAFSTTGTRALVLGGYGSPGVGRVYEYRHKLKNQTDFTDVSIPNFDKPPYNAASGVSLHDAAWRPGCDGGLIVGGCSSYSCKKAYVVEFQVSNGKKCP